MRESGLAGTVAGCSDGLGEIGMTVWIYVDARKQVGDKDHLKVFASEDAANAWFAEHDPEGVAFEYPVST
jgi:hypothetical protein